MKSPTDVPQKIKGKNKTKKQIKKTRQNNNKKRKKIYIKLELRKKQDFPAKKIQKS